MKQSDKDKAFCEVMERRFQACKKVRDPKLRDGQRFRDYYSGKRSIVIGSANEPESQSAEDEGNTWVKVGYPLFYQLVEALVPAIMIRDPICQVRVRQGADDVTRIRGRVVEQVQDYWWREGAEEGFEREYELALYDCIFNGMSVLEADLDNVRVQPRLTQVNCKDFLYDAEADTRIESLRWCAVRKTVGLQSAKRLFKEHKDDLKANVDEWRGEQVQESQQYTDPDFEKMNTTRFTYWRVYIKGDNPQTNEGDQKARDKTEPAEGKQKQADGEPGDEALYKGKNEVVYIAKLDSNYVVLKREPWPAVFDHDSFPLVFMRMTVDPQCFHPDSLLAPVEHLQRHSNWALSFHVTDVRDSSQKKIIYDKSKLDDEQIEALENLENRTMIGVKNGLPKDSVWVLDYGSGNQAAVQMVRDLSEIFKESTSLKELVQEGRSHESATAAAMKDKWRDVKISKPAKKLETFVRIGMRKMLQIAMSTITAEEIARITGPELLQLVEEPYFDESGELKTAMVSPVWPDEWTPEQIREEIDFMIEPNSMRFVSREQIVQELGAIKQHIQADVATLTQMGAAVNPLAIAGVMFRITRKMAQTLDIRNLDEFFPKPEDIIMLPGGGNALPPAPGGEFAGPQSPVTPQAQARIQRLQETGAA